MLPSHLHTATRLLARATRIWDRDASCTIVPSAVALIIAATLMTGDRVGAAIVDHGTYMTDTTSGLDWLNVNQTIGMSYNDVSAQLGTGGQFQGWSYAQVHVIQQLLQNIGATLPLSGWSSANNGLVAPLLNHWGTTRPFPETRLINGTFFGPNAAVTILSDDPNQSISSSSDFMSLNETTIAPQNSNSIYGSALYRISATVPTPASWPLLSAAAMFLGLARRKRDNR